MIKRIGASFAMALALTATHRVHAAHATDAFADGAVVRVQSSSIEQGWFTGRIRLDKNKCWMVHLDKATRDHYTMLALLVIDELEVSHGSQWTPVAVKPALLASPASCHEYGAD